jgi:hypothetical protein
MGQPIQFIPAAGKHTRYLSIKESSKTDFSLEEFERQIKG